MRPAARLIAFLLCVAVLFAGCSKSQQKSVSQAMAPKRSDSSGPATHVMMLGRSVMSGWNDHWSRNNGQPFKDAGFNLYYSDIDSPDGMMDSVKGRLDEDKGKAEIIFFKLCFDDFQSGDKATAVDNLKRNKGLVQKAYQIVVVDHGKKLIIGNALPKVKDATDKDLIWNHKQYNQWLNEFASTHSGQVFIFDEYGVLAGLDGSLKSEYASAGDDSHPNDDGYDALDGPFLALLQSTK